MTPAFFRPEAIAHHRAPIWGEITLPVPVPITLTTVFLAASLAVCAGFLALGTYTRKAHVAGFLVPHLGVSRVMAPRDGTVVAVLVHEGELVRQGQKLLSVSGDQANDHGENVDGTMLDSFAQQIDRLKGQIALEQQQAESARATIQAAIDALQRMIGALQTQHALQIERSAIARRDMEAIEGLVQRGDMSMLEQRRRQDSFLAQLQAESTTALAILDKQAELARQRGLLADVPVSSAQRVGTLRNAIGDIAAKITEIDGRRAYQINAPMAGRVSALQAWVGKPLEAGTAQMSIVPEGDAMQAELLVPARAIGFIKPGQHVRISYDTFPTQTFGFADGQVQTISRTLLRPADMAGPLVFAAPAYRVTVALASQTIHGNGTDIALQTDTQLQADIMLDTRNLLGWMTGPLHRAWGRL